MSNTLQLRDGRALGYAEYGDLAGKPIFLFGGSSSRLQRHPDDSIADSLGVRLITAERPGFGLSTRKPGRTPLGWADDVIQLADALKLERFAVIGASQGSPSTCATAYKHPDRVALLCLVSALAPFTVKGLNKENPFFLKLLPVLANRAPFLLTMLYSPLVPTMQKDPVKFFQRSLRNLPPSDQAIMRQPDVQALFAQDLAEAARQGAGGFVDDIVAACRPWGFDPKDIRVKTVIWQGDADVNVPPAMARYFAGTIPGAKLTMVANQGHFMFIPLWREILTDAVRAF